jgi:hypothetical protein
MTARYPSQADTDLVDAGLSNLTDAYTVKKAPHTHAPTIDGHPICPPNDALLSLTEPLQAIIERSLDTHPPPELDHPDDLQASPSSEIA